MSMRITNSMRTSNMLSNLNINLNRLDKYQRQMYTQKRITKLSDDPVGIMTVMQSKAKVAQLEKHQDTIASAQSWLTSTESAQMDMQKQIQRAYELCTDMASDAGKGELEREAAAVEIKQIMEHLVQSGNASNADQYIFGGYNTSNPPFSFGAAGELLYNGIEMYPTPDTVALNAEATEKLEYEIGYGIRTEVNFTGVDLMGVGDKNIYGILDGLYQDLMDSSKSAADINQHISKLQGAQSDLLGQIADVGGRTNRLEMIDNRYEDEILNYKTRQSAVEDIDLAEVFTQFSTASAVYQAALQTGAKIIQPSLMDYIR